MYDSGPEAYRSQICLKSNNISKVRTHNRFYLGCPLKSQAPTLWKHFQNWDNWLRHMANMASLTNVFMLWHKHIGIASCMVVYFKRFVIYRTGILLYLQPWLICHLRWRLFSWIFSTMMRRLMQIDQNLSCITWWGCLTVTCQMSSKILLLILPLAGQT